MLLVAALAVWLVLSVPVALWAGRRLRRRCTGYSPSDGP